MDRGTCQGCGAAVRWVRMAKSGKLHPVDDRPEKMVVEGQDGGYVAVAWRSHFASCRFAERYKKGPER